MPKITSIRPSVLIELRLVTDTDRLTNKQTDTGPQLVNHRASITVARIKKPSMKRFVQNFRLSE